MEGSARPPNEQAALPGERPSRLWPLVAIVALGIGVAALAAAPIGKPPPPAFYSAAAQIIPLLIIALAVEGRARDVWDPYPGYVRIVVIFALCLGELAGILGASGFLSNVDAKIQETKGLVGPGKGSSVALAGLTAYALGIGFGAVDWVALVHRGGHSNSNADDQSDGGRTADGTAPDPVAENEREPIHIILDIRLDRVSSPPESPPPRP